MPAEPKKTFLRDLGLLLHIPAFLFIPTFFVIIYFEEYFALIPFLAMTVISFASGQILFRLFKNSEKSKSKYSLAIVSLAWLIIPILGAIPFYGNSFSGEELIGEAVIFSDVSSAIFESMSGFTSTGLSMLENPETIPHSLQWWRSISEWLGGIGVIILAIAVFDISTSADKLYQAEAMNWIIENKNLKKTIKNIWIIYILFTLLSIFLFYGAGMPGWEAINHGLTAVCTGGFTITADSFISYNNIIKWIAIGIMIFGALSFQIHYLMIIKRSLKRILKLTELKVFSVLLIISILFVIAINYQEELVNNVFQVSSALGTCGFNAVETPYMPVSSLFLLIIAMILGGNSSSTTGGLKTRKIVWIIKGLIKSMRDLWKGSPDNQDKYVSFNEEDVAEKDAKEQIINSAYIFALWIISISAGTFFTLILEGDNYSLSQILFDVSSALNNVGLSAGLTGHGMNTISKWIFIILMWIGRLEIYGCLVLFFIPIYFYRSKFIQPIKYSENYLYK